VSRHLRTRGSMIFELPSKETPWRSNPLCYEVFYQMTGVALGF